MRLRHPKESKEEEKEVWKGKKNKERVNGKGAKIDEVHGKRRLAWLMGKVSLKARMKISVLMDISILEFYGYIDEYFYINIDN